MKAHEFRLAFAKLPPVPADEQAHASRSWPYNQIAFRQHAQQDDPRRMLCWSTTRATMYVDNAEYIKDEWEALQHSPNPERWHRACKRTDLEYPTPPMIELLDNNLIHQCFHLWQLEQITGKLIDQYKAIIEFGGGYGAMAHVIRRLGFRGPYIIFDLPEMCLLQQYYLSNVDCLVPVRSLIYGPTVSTCMQTDLMIACWSLSETEIPLRSKFLQQIKSNNYLIAYGSEWFNIDNERYFRGLSAKLVDYCEWTRKPAAESSAYLIGVKRAWV